MSYAFPLLAAIVLATLGAFVPVEALPWVILATMAATMWAVWRFPPDLERFILACSVCGFRQEMSAPAGCGMVVHRCSHTEGH